MTTITKDIANEVIEYFNPKGYTHTFIGDVLQEMEFCLWNKEFTSKQCIGSESKLLGLWRKLNFKKSLQEILADAEWKHTEMERMLRVSEPKLQPPAAELFVFLHSLIQSK